MERDDYTYQDFLRQVHALSEGRTVLMGQDVLGVTRVVRECYRSGWGPAAVRNLLCSLWPVESEPKLQQLQAVLRAAAGPELFD